MLRYASVPSPPPQPAISTARTSVNHSGPCAAHWQCSAVQCRLQTQTECTAALHKGDTLRRMTIIQALASILRRACYSSVASTSRFGFRFVLLATHHPPALQILAPLRPPRPLNRQHQANPCSYPAAKPMQDRSNSQLPRVAHEAPLSLSYRCLSKATDC
ncbi:hypothetical protein DM02DRAFT_129664 [Periconia macrospinosa]|uniref:Uncharacterized protein n=1 Tax=Periconia macrospinosa TaxID=97972 RepID=A0A2V1DGC0_9PLEO|nr:hypothetical protein DM02DRAFT_129664 [Periconia macrospinosa]